MLSSKTGNTLSPSYTYLYYMYPIGFSDENAYASRHFRSSYKTALNYNYRVTPYLTCETSYRHPSGTSTIKHILPVSYYTSNILPDGTDWSMSHARNLIPNLGGLCQSSTPYLCSLWSQLHFCRATTKIGFSASLTSLR